MTWSRSGALVLILLLVGCTAPPPTPTESALESTRPAVSSSPTATPAPSATTSAITQANPPTAAPVDTTGWTTYVSERYGFAIGHPPDWSVIPAERSWTMEADAGYWESPGQEGFISADRDVVVTAWVARYAGEESLSGVHRWIGEYCRAADACLEWVGALGVPLCNGRGGCHPGLLMPEEPQAFFTGGVRGQRMTVVAVMRPPDWPVSGYGNSLQLLEAFLSTMDVCPAEEDPRGCDSETPLAGAATGDPLTARR